jgi:hypothetical protein
VHGRLALTCEITWLILNRSCTNHNFQITCGYTLFDGFIDSSSVKSQRMDLSSRSSCSRRPNKQELEIMRLCEEMRKQWEFMQVFMQHNLAIYPVSIDDVNSKFLYFNTISSKVTHMFNGQCSKRA